MRLLFLILLFLSTNGYCDSESTFSGKTAQAHIIQSKGVSLRPRPYLDFEGSQSCVDSGGKTVCTATGSGGGGGSGINAGTPNQEAYYATADSLSSGIITDNGTNIGIGSINPSQKLDVKGTVRMTNFLMTSSPSSGYVLTSDSNGNGSWISPTGGTNYWTLVGSDIHSNNTGNVGVNVTSPTVRFAVGSTDGSHDDGYIAELNGGTGHIREELGNQSGTSRDAGSLEINSGGTKSIILDARTDSATGYDIGTGDNIYSLSYFSGGDTTEGNINVYDSNSIKVQLNGNHTSYFNGGNVGIGTTVAPNALYVAGTAAMQGFQLPGNGASPGFVLTSNSVGIGTWVASPSGSGSGTVTSVTLATPSSTLTLGGTNPVTTSGTINADINLTHANTWTGQQIFNTANVGIGSVTPGQTLDVNGTVRAIAFINRGGLSTQFQKADGSLDPSTYLTGNQTITVTGDATGSGTTSIGLTLKNTGTAGTYRSTTFDAQGRETSGTNPTTFSSYGISDSSANLRAALTDSTGTGANVFATSPNLIANVGIGSVSPGQALDVQGTVRMTGFNLNSSPTSGFVLTSDSSGNGTWKAGAGGGVSSFSGDGLILNNSSSTGAVTATTAAQTQNTILGAATSTTLASLAVPSCSTGSSALTWTTNSGFGCNSIAGGTGSNYWIQNTGVGIGTYANVGIGTITPQAGLVVINGNVGIGTWTAGSMLQIGTNNSIGLRISSSGAITTPSNSTTITVGSIASNDSGGLLAHGRDNNAGSAGGAEIRGGNDSAGGVTGAGLFHGGDVTNNDAFAGGLGTFRGGDITNASATGIAGNNIVRPGGTANSNGANGFLQLSNTFQTIAGNFSAINDVACMTANQRVGDCITSSKNLVGIGIGTSAPAIVQFGGIATNVPFDNTYSPVAGWYACASPTTAGKVLPQSTPCTTTQQVGIITQGATSVGIGTFMVQTQIGSGSQATSFISYQPGLLSAVNSTIGVNYQFSKSSTVDNLIGSAVTFSCIANPTVTMYECGTSTTCSGPTTIGTVTVTAAGTLVAGTVSNSAITAGDYIGWAITAGTCASIDISATAQVHSN